MQSAANKSEVPNPAFMVVLKVGPILLSFLMHSVLNLF